MENAVYSSDAIIISTALLASPNLPAALILGAIPKTIFVVLSAPGRISAQSKSPKKPGLVFELNNSKP